MSSPSKFYNLDTDPTLSANSDHRVASQKAVKTLVDTKQNKLLAGYGIKLNENGEISSDLNHIIGFGSIIFNSENINPDYNGGWNIIYNYDAEDEKIDDEKSYTAIIVSRNNLEFNEDKSNIVLSKISKTFHRYNHRRVISFNARILDENKPLPGLLWDLYLIEVMNLNPTVYTRGLVISQYTTNLTSVYNKTEIDEKLDNLQGSKIIFRDWSE